jgi:D-alanyl-lipoteichoic acid acyltransferase DltB (MBOAT superfamily)
MTFNNPLLFMFLAAILVAMSLGILRPAKQYLLLLFSLLFAALFYRESPWSFALLLASIAAHWLTLRIMAAIAAPNLRHLVHYVWLALTIAAFLIVKDYSWLTNIVVPRGTWKLSLESFGWSYIIFRQIHLGVEVRDGMLDRVGLREYASYILAFWTLTAGPVQRFGAFREQFQQFTADNTAATPVLLGLNRVMFGYLKMFALATYCWQYAKVTTFTEHVDGAHLALFLLAYPCYMYLNFSGYCDIVVGIAQAVGFTLPENFNHPYVARNMVDYWNRWHITVSQFFRDYMYFPIYTALCRRRMPHLLAVIPATLTSFLVMGAWHGNTISFAVFGLVHGLGVVAVNVYTELLKALLPRGGIKRYKQNRAVHVCALLLCQSYVILAFLPFAYSWPELMQVYRCLLQWATTSHVC